MSKFWKQYPDIVQELNSVKKIIKLNIKKLEKVLSFKVDTEGKMLRPAFLILAAKFGKYEADKIRTVAAAIEMMHMATLIHDDIVDESKLRRGTETIQTKYGKDYAVYAGDFMLCQCFILLSEFHFTMENLRRISIGVSKICMGEIIQHNTRYSSGITIKRYIRIISGKTAALVAISLYTGAIEAECEKSLAQKLGKIGYNIGMAFQIVDDILDYKGEESKLGKKAQTDLMKGDYTLPLIYAMQEDKDNIIRNVLDNSLLDEDNVKKIIKLVNELKGVERAEELAKKFTLKAYNNIDKLPDCEAKTILKEVTQKLLKRTY